MTDVLLPTSAATASAEFILVYRHDMSAYMLQFEPQIIWLSATCNLCYSASVRPSRRQATAFKQYNWLNDACAGLLHCHFQGTEEIGQSSLVTHLWQLQRESTGTAHASCLPQAGPVHTAQPGSA